MGAPPARVLLLQQFSGARVSWRAGEPSWQRYGVADHPPPFLTPACCFVPLFLHICSKVWDAISGDEKSTYSHPHIVKGVDFSEVPKMFSGGFPSAASHTRALWLLRFGCCAPEHFFYIIDPWRVCYTVVWRTRVGSKRSEPCALCTLCALVSVHVLKRLLAVAPCVVCEGLETSTDGMQ